MALDLKNLTPKELQTLIADANAQMAQARDSQIQSVKGKIDALLRTNGLTLNDVYPTRTRKAPVRKGLKGTVLPKYQNPADPSQTWSGRGRQPAWFASALKRRGVTVDSLLIGRPASPAAPAKKGASRKRIAKRASKK